MNLEVQVRRTAIGIAGVPDEAEDVSCPHVPRVEHPRGIAREMRVIELVGCCVAHPEPPAAEPVPSDAVDRSVRDRYDRGPDRGEDVGSVVPLPANVASERTVRIPVARYTDDGEDVFASTERRCDLERLRDSAPMRTRMRWGRTYPGGRRIGHVRPVRDSPRWRGGVGRWWHGWRRGLGGGRRRLRARRRIGLRARRGRRLRGRRWRCRQSRRGCGARRWFRRRRRCLGESRGCNSAPEEHHRCECRDELRQDHDG